MSILNIYPLTVCFVIYYSVFMMSINIIVSNCMTEYFMPISSVQKNVYIKNINVSVRLTCYILLYYMGYFSIDL